MPDLSHKVDDIVFPLDEVLDGTASSIATSLRKKGRSVDLVEDKRLKWLVSIITCYISLDLACLWEIVTQFLIYYVMLGVHTCIMTSRRGTSKKTT